MPIPFRAQLLGALQLSALLLGLIHTVAAAISNHAEYLGGTLKSLPVDASGSLKFDNSTALEFKYGKSVFRLPYNRIRDYHLGETTVLRRLVARVPLPRMPFGHRDVVLDLSFRDDAGALGTASFRIPAASRPVAEWALAQRTDNAAKTVVADRTKLQDSWWGDKYWKTNRNQAFWTPSATETITTGTK